MPADRKTPQHVAESDGFTPDELMRGAKSKAQWIRQQIGLSDSATACSLSPGNSIIFIGLPL